MIPAKLVFYDTSSAYYAGYYLTGFAELAASSGLRLRITNRLPQRLNNAVRDADWQHLLFAVAIFRLRASGREWYLCIDGHDSNALDAPGKPGGYHLPLLRTVDAWFKVNYNPAIIDETTALREHRDKIHPVAQFFPIRPARRLALARRLLLAPALFGFRPGLDHKHPYAGVVADARKRVTELRNFPSFDGIVACRNHAKDIDVFFVTSYRGNERHAREMADRYRVIKRLLATEGLRIAAGLNSFGPLPDRYADVHHPRLKRGEYTQTLARSRVVVYTRGMDGCISSKFSLSMAVGNAVIGEPLMNNPALMERNPHLAEQLAWLDPDDIAEHAIDLARHPERAQEFGAMNAAMFDRQIAPRAAAQYVLLTLSGQREPLTG
jgi:hypothetical protein